MLTLSNSKQIYFKPGAHLMQTPDKFVLGRRPAFLFVANTGVDIVKPERECAITLVTTPFLGNLIKGHPRPLVKHYSSYSFPVSSPSVYKQENKLSTYHKNRCNLTVLLRVFCQRYSAQYGLN